MTTEAFGRSRQPVSYTLERYALAARRFFAAPTPGHRRELKREREAVREALAAGERPTTQDLALARRAAADQRARDRQQRLCHCGRCWARRRALRAYTLGFKDGVLGRLGKRRMPDELRSFKKHFKDGLAEGRRVVEEVVRRYDERLSKTL